MDGLAKEISDMAHDKCIDAISISELSYHSEAQGKNWNFKLQRDIFVAWKAFVLGRDFTKERCKLMEGSSITVFDERSSITALDYYNIKLLPLR